MTGFCRIVLLRPHSTSQPVFWTPAYEIPPKLSMPSSAGACPFSCIGPEAGSTVRLTVLYDFVLKKEGVGIDKREEEVRGCLPKEV
jgi:hypothetical protein